MAGTLDVDLSELHALGTRYAGAEPVVRDELTKAMTRSALLVEGQARRVAPVDTGRLRGSITHEVRPFGGGVRGTVGTTVVYAPPVEIGRRAGAAMPPAGALLGWMGRHGIPASAEFVVRRAIGRRGIPARPFLRRALREMEGRIRQEFAQVPRRVLASLKGR